MNQLGLDKSRIDSKEINKQFEQKLKNSGQHNRLLTSLSSRSLQLLTDPRNIISHSDLREKETPDTKLKRTLN